MPNAPPRQRYGPWCPLHLAKRARIIRASNYVAGDRAVWGIATWLLTHFGWQQTHCVTMIARAGNGNESRSLRIHPAT
eukprot:5088714-Lingulodinium_polyedra.AAC.1